MALTAGWGQSSHAQAIGPLIQEPNDVPGQRVIPEYTPIGYNLAGFDALPSVAFGTQLDNNIFTRNTVKASDIVLQSEPRIRLRKERRSGSITIDANARFSHYAKLTDQNSTEYRLQGIYVRGAKGPESLTVNTGYRREAVQRGTAENDLTGGEPLMRRVLHGSLTGRMRFNRLSVDAQLLAVRQRFEDIGNPSGRDIPQGFRNVDHFGFRAITAYETTSRTSVFSSLAYDRFDYATSPLLDNRDAVNWSATAGVRYEVTRILHAQLAIGYRRYDFRDKTLGAIGGLAVSGHLRYFPSRVFAIRGTLEQSNTTSPYDLVGAVTLTTARVEAEYEMRRNLSWLGAAKFMLEDYAKQPYSARRAEVNVGPRYRFNRWLTIDANAGYAQRLVRGPAPFEPFSQFYGMVTLRLAR
ncbi:outer membrane beta-barrel protein [Novosphingobium gossypii]|uniref:outer membrane beta-barrel protein n=1 Tax=Novosphingobium gossypii TaxID=1604774 RepID=UPI003D19BFA2